MYSAAPSLTPITALGNKINVDMASIAKPPATASSVGTSLADPTLRQTPQFFIPTKKLHVLQIVKNVLRNRGWIEHAMGNNGDFSRAEDLNEWEFLWSYYDHWAFNAVKNYLYIIGFSIVNTNLKLNNL